jgi:hypothetical protein
VAVLAQPGERFNRQPEADDVEVQLGIELFEVVRREVDIPARLCVAVAEEDDALTGERFRCRERAVFWRRRLDRLSVDKIDSVNDSDEMFLRNDTPGCVRHDNGDTFSEMYLSYLSGPKGVRIPANEFFEPFPPDLKYGLATQIGFDDQRDMLLMSHG